MLKFDCRYNGELVEYFDSDVDGSLTYREHGDVESLTRALRDRVVSLDRAAALRPTTTEEMMAKVRKLVGSDEDVEVDGVPIEGTVVDVEIVSISEALYTVLRVNLNTGKAFIEVRKVRDPSHFFYESQLPN